MVCWKVDVNHDSDSFIIVVSSPPCSFELLDFSIAERKFDGMKV